MLDLDQIHQQFCFMGQRNLIHELRDRGYHIGRKRARRLMKLLGIEAMVPKLNTNKRSKDHKLYPYLLRDKEISSTNEVWYTDITYILMERGHIYLIAIMDWRIRVVLAWEESNTMDTAFCI